MWLATSVGDLTAMPHVVGGDSRAETTVVVIAHPGAARPEACAYVSRLKRDPGFLFPTPPENIDPGSAPRALLDHNRA